MSDENVATLDLDELRARGLPRLDHSFIKMENVGETNEERAKAETAASKLRAALDQYLRIFIKPESKGADNLVTGSQKCVGCGAALDGLFGTFQWGLAHGEGACSGCGYPCRAYHRVMDGGAEPIMTFQFVLQYHPEELRAAVSLTSGAAPEGES